MKFIMDRKIFSNKLILQDYCGINKKLGCNFRPLGEPDQTRRHRFDFDILRFDYQCLTSIQGLLFF